MRVWPQPQDDAAAEARTIASRDRRACAPATLPVAIAVLVQTRALAGPDPAGTAEVAFRWWAWTSAALAGASRWCAIWWRWGQALLDAGDRAAWLAVLRAPACGLASLLADLLRFAEAAGPEDRWWSIFRDADACNCSPQSGRAAARAWRPVLLAGRRSRGSRHRQPHREYRQRLGGQCRVPRCHRARGGAGSTCWPCVACCNVKGESRHPVSGNWLRSCVTAVRRLVQTRGY